MLKNNYSRVGMSRLYYKDQIINRLSSLFIR